MLTAAIYHDSILFFSTKNGIIENNRILIFRQAHPISQNSDQQKRFDKMVFRKIHCIILAMIIALILPITYAAASDSAPEKGDANGDGRVTAADARLTLRFAAKLISAADINFEAADFDENGRITAADARKIIRVAAKLDPNAFISVAEPTTVKPPKPTTEAPVTSKIISVPLINQYPEFPSGCESVAAVMNLKYYGFNISVTRFIDEYLPIGSAPIKNSGKWYSSDPNESFLGDPTKNTGWGIWAKGLARAIERYLDRQSGRYTVTYTYNESLDSLCEKYVKNNIPVIVWVTAGMEPPRQGITAHIIGSSKTFTWISPNHCMVLVGFDQTGYYFNDPITGKMEKYAKAESTAAFKGNGSQAVIIKQTS